MTRGDILCRSLADTLAQLTVRVAPPQRKLWMQAMAAELGSIDRGLEALRWAGGCLYTGLLMYCREAAFLSQRWVRWGIALWAGYQAEDNLGTALAVVSYKQPGLGLTPLARWYAGDDYRVIYPILEAVSSWEVVFGVIAAALYLFAGAQLLRQRFHRARTLVLALAVCFGLWLYELSKPLYFQSFPLSDHLHDALGYVVTSLLAWLVWAGASRSVIDPGQSRD